MEAKPGYYKRQTQATGNWNQVSDKCKRLYKIRSKEHETRLSEKSWTFSQKTINNKIVEYIEYIEEYRI